LTNVDRTARNTNMLNWKKELWLIDHGAALYFHHSGQEWEEQAKRPFVQIKDHVLLSFADNLEEVDEAFRAILTPDRIRSIVALIPTEWLDENSFAVSGEQMRDIYAEFLNTRIASSLIFVKEAQHARATII
jgi:hypothetical protein